MAQWVSMEDWSVGFQSPHRARHSSIGLSQACSPRETGGEDRNPKSGQLYTRPGVYNNEALSQMVSVVGVRGLCGPGCPCGPEDNLGSQFSAC